MIHEGAERAMAWPCEQDLAIVTAVGRCTFVHKINICGNVVVLKIVQVLLLLLHTHKKYLSNCSSGCFMVGWWDYGRYIVLSMA